MSANEKSGPSGPEHFPNLAATIFRAISAATLLHLHFCGLYSGVCTYVLFVACHMQHVRKAQHTDAPIERHTNNPQLSHQLGHNLVEVNGGLESA